MQHYNIHYSIGAPAPAAMKTFGVLLTFSSNSYLDAELDRRCNLFRLYEQPPERRLEFMNANANIIRAVVCVPSATADAATIDALPNLELVATMSVGVDKVDLDKCKERGIRVTNTSDVLTDEVADYAVGLAIAVSRQLCEGDRFVRRGEWKARGDFELATKFSGKRVGIIGLGRIGIAIAKRTEAFNCIISYYTRTKKPYTNYKYHSSVVDLAATSDVLVVACPLTEETRHIVNREVIDALGPKGVLINIGRGAHVDQAELISALLEGRLGGAGLDVFESEPDVPDELSSLDNVVLMPHAASGSFETRKAMADLVIGNLEAHVLNNPLLTPVI